MATKDDILTQQNAEVVQQPRLDGEVLSHENGGTAPRAGQQSGDTQPVNDGSAIVTPTQETSASEQAAPESVQAESKKTLSYVEMFERSNPYKPPTPEDVDKERKKRKREAIFAAIGDGLSALSNLYFTTQGAPNAYDPQNSLLARARARWDKLDKERDGKNKDYYGGYIRAHMADTETARDDRNWRYKLGRDAAADKRYDEQQAKDEKRYNDNIAYRDKKDSEAKERWEQQFEEGKRQFNTQNTRLTQQAKDATEARKAAAAASAARGVRGKRIGFADGNGNEVGIFGNVWKGSMQQVYDAIIADGTAKPTELQKINGMSASQKEDFVKENWTKSPSARAIMLTLSKLDPAEMANTTQNDEPEDDDFSEYIVK